MTPLLLKLDAALDLVDRVHGALLDAILDGTLPAGVRLMQEDIARQLAVSRQPVLQALRLLKADGLVIDAPGRGVLVTPLHSEELANVYQVRAALDVLAARLAAQRRALLPAQLIERGHAAVRQRDVRAMVEADIAFHSAIYEASGNALIAPSAKVHWRHIRRAMAAVLQRATLRETVWQEHEAIAAAIAAGEVDTAALLISGHDQRASAYLCDQLSGQASRAAGPARPTTSSPGANRHAAHRSPARTVRA